MSNPNWPRTITPRGIAAVAWLMMLFPALLSAEPVTLTIQYPEEKNAFHDAAAEILRQAYDDIGIDIEFRTFPAERALQQSNKGIIDGELVRIEGIEERYTNLIRIPVMHVAAEQMAFVATEDLALSDWDSLAPYRVAFHRGYKVAEQATQGMSVHLTDDDAAALRMVANGRMDVAIANRFSGMKAIQENELSGIWMHEPPLQVDPLFHYLHKKHADVVPRITAALSELKTSGRMAEIRSRFGIE